MALRLNIDSIADQSKKLEVPFRNLLAGVLLEQTAKRMFEGSFARNLCVCNAEELSPDFYKKFAPLRIDAFYFTRKRVSEGLTVGKPICSEVLDLLSSELFPANDGDSLKWKKSLGESSIYATAKLANYEVPIEIRLREVKEGDFISIPVALRQTLADGVTANIMTYPAEMQIADCYEVILERLELLGELGPYLKIYEALHRLALSGRQVQEQIELRCKNKGIPIDESRINNLLGFFSDKYMKKRWKSLLRVKKLTAPTWDEALTKVLGFLAPIWAASVKHDIFFEDWMPELGRFM